MFQVDAATVAGEITYIDPRVQGNRVMVRGRIDNAKEAFKPGMQGTVVVESIAGENRTPFDPAMATPGDPFK